MNDVLMQGSTMIDCVRVQQNIKWRKRKKIWNFEFPFFFLYHWKLRRRLNELVRLCFGKSFDKSTQTNNWPKRPFKQVQFISSSLFLLKEFFCKGHIEKYSASRRYCIIDRITYVGLTSVLILIEFQEILMEQYSF